MGVKKKPHASKKTTAEKNDAFEKEVSEKGWELEKLFKGETPGG